jgi:hypothetical protein
VFELRCNLAEAGKGYIREAKRDVTEGGDVRWW